MSQPVTADDVARILRVWQLRRRIAYGVALALGIVMTIFFGWYGFWLGLGAVVLVKVAFWAFPLIKLSYANESGGADGQRPSAERGR